MTAFWLIVIVLLNIGASWLGVRSLIGYLSANNIVDRPNHRTLHQGVVPRGGGLVIVISLTLALLVVAVGTARLGFFFGLFVLVSLWASLSWWDDRRDIAPVYRFAGQFVIAILTTLAFGWVSSVQLSAQLWLDFSWFGFVLTVFGVLWMANLYNFMDGMDGMAASQTILASSTIAFWFWQAGDIGLTIICLVLASSSYGFLLWNWRPAKIFMGDVGSVTIGGFFSVLLIIGVTRYDFPVMSFLLLFGVFIVDTSVTIIRRMFHREKFWLPHRKHYYQRLANIGVSHTKIVIASIILMSLCSLIATISLMYRDIIGFSIIVELILLACIAAVVVWLESKGQHSGSADPDL